MLRKRNVLNFFPFKYTKKYANVKNVIDTVPTVLRTKTLKHVLCKYFLHGKCKKTDCTFSHNLKDFSDEHIVKMLNERIDEQVEGKSKQKENVAFTSPLQNFL